MSERATSKLAGDIPKGLHERFRKICRERDRKLQHVLEEVIAEFVQMNEPHVEVDSREVCLSEKMFAWPR